MATDLAEFVGAALGLNLLFGMPLFIAALLTGLIAFVILGLQASGFRRLEATITGLVGLIVMGIAGVINLAMLTTAAAVFNSRGLISVGTDLGQVFNGLEQYVGKNSGVIFGIALLASGISSSSVGTLAGQVVMQGFIRRKISVFLLRSITMVPALIVIGAHFDPSRALVLNQVFLSFGIPFAMIPLVLFTRDRKLMGSLVNSRWTNLGAYGVATMIITLNVFLLYQTLFGS